MAGGNIIRTANLVAEMPQRKLPNGIGNVVPGGDINGLKNGTKGVGAMGRVPDSCVLTLTVGDQGVNVDVSLYLYSHQVFLDTGDGWVKAGAAAGKYKLTFEPRGTDSWDAPEQTPYCFVGSAAIAEAYVRDTAI